MPAGSQEAGCRPPSTLAIAAMERIAIFLRFLRFGLLAFGGPVAQIAMIRRELVDEEQWLPPERFNRLLAVYQALPGPEAHELCVHLGRMKGGRLGGLLAGLGFMLPGFLIVLALAMAYSRLDLDQPLLAAALLGAQVAVVALVAVAVPRIGGHILKERWHWAIAVAAFAAFAATWLLGDSNPVTTAGQPATPVTTAALFLTGLKGGLLTFGGAYTAIPFVRGDTVGRGWLDDGTFLDGLALSGMVPAPLVIFVTFAGYVIGGLAGALAMTVGMFLPAFAFGLIFYDRLERVIEDSRLHLLLDAIAAAVVGVIAATAVDLCWRLAERLPSLAGGIALFAAAVAILWFVRSRWTALWLVPTAALAGIALFR
jgi:chromate transporter